MKRLRFLYGRYGGVPRVLLKTIYLYAPIAEWILSVESYNTSVVSAITSMLGGSSALSTLEDVYYQRASNKVVVFSPAGINEISRTYTLCIGTGYLAHLVSEAVLEARKSELRAFYRRLMEVPSLHNAAGRVFERLVHDYYRRGGTFSLGHALERGRMLKSLTFTCTGTEEFSSLAELKRTLHKANSSIVERLRKNVYFRPVKSNLTSIDSFTIMDNGLKGSSENIVMPVLFQITVALQHDIKVLGITELYDNLPAEAKKSGCLLFVVPEGSKLRKKQEYKPADSNHRGWMDVIKQRIVYISEEELCKGR